MSFRRDGVTAPLARLRRMPSYGLGLLASLTLVVASLSAVVLGTQSASAAEPSTKHSVASKDLVGHPPTNARATVVKDRADAPQHRAAPWTPLAVAAAGPMVAYPRGPAESAVAPPKLRHGYDAPTPQGRAPPR